jgi:hypothetical protein
MGAIQTDFLYGREYKTFLGLMPERHHRGASLRVHLDQTEELQRKKSLSKGNAVRIASCPLLFFTVKTIPKSARFQNVSKL